MVALRLSEVGVNARDGRHTRLSGDSTEAAAGTSTRGPLWSPISATSFPEARSFRRKQQESRRSSTRRELMLFKSRTLPLGHSNGGCEAAGKSDPSLELGCPTQLRVCSTNVCLLWRSWALTNYRRPRLWSLSPKQRTGTCYARVSAGSASAKGSGGCYLSVAVEQRGQEPGTACGLSQGHRLPPDELW